MFGVEWAVIWNFILCILVSVHLITEYAHYIHEFLSQRRKKKLLDHIHEDIEKIMKNQQDYHDECPMRKKD